MKEPREIRAIALALALVSAAYVVADVSVRRYHFGGWDAPGTRSAARWLEAGMLTPERPPLYEGVLGVVMAITGRDAFVVAGLALQALITFGVLVALFLLAKRVTGRAAWGLMAVGLVSLNHLFVAGNLVVKDTVLYGAILMALTGLLVCARRTSWFPPVAGALCALGWLTRPTGILLLPVLVVVLWRDWRDAGRRAATRAAGGLVLSFSLPLLAWAAYQHAHYGFVAIAGVSNAENLRLGNNPALMETYPFIHPDTLRPALGIKPADSWAAMFNNEDQTEEHYREAFRFITESPLEVLAIVPRKLAAFFVPVKFPLGYGMGRQNPDGSWRIDNYVARRIGKGDGIMALPGVLAFFAGLVWWRRLPVTGRFIVLIVGLTALIHVATFAETRFRLPFDPLLALLFVQMASTMVDRRIAPMLETRRRPEDHD